MTIRKSSDVSGLAGEIARLFTEEDMKAAGALPVERWNPPDCGAIDMEIRRDGSWHYMKTPIAREALLRLFASVLRKDEDGETYLVTPVEKVRIRVEDAAFLAVELKIAEQGGEPLLAIRTNTGNIIAIDADHPLRFVHEGEDGALKPYVRVRGRLEALFSRALVHDLVALGEEAEIDGEAMFVIRSAGAVFPVMRMKDIGDEAYE
ncbi:DUF1285 domain-containing protein [Martelella sp. HB161492]|uniref:DUF1285 domain-containing protein n=1 Tax=Martelella sp. HB161492 TaxID=2720726 RepID=UPI001591EC87|nr:DUF1285 domain-containing protein [Martelella sp. HB161492]